MRIFRIKNFVMRYQTIFALMMSLPCHVVTHLNRWSWVFNDRIKEAIISTANFTGIKKIVWISYRDVMSIVTRLCNQIKKGTYSSRLYIRTIIRKIVRDDELYIAAVAVDRLSSRFAYNTSNRMLCRRAIRCIGARTIYAQNVFGNAMFVRKNWRYHIQVVWCSSAQPKARAWHHYAFSTRRR